MRIEFSVHGDRLEAVGRNEAYTGNVNTYQCVFQFSEAWDGFSPVAVFSVDGEFITVSIADGQCDLPAEALTDRKNIRIGVYGTKSAGQDDYQRISTNWTPPFYIREGAYCEGTAPEVPTPELWEQYVAQMQAAIDNGCPQIGENGNWFLWDVSEKQLADSGLPSRGIQGPKGDKGDKPQKGVDYFTPEDIESLGIDEKADKVNAQGGFHGGQNAQTTGPGGAIGEDAQAGYGGAGGNQSKTDTGGALGAGAASTTGGAIGQNTNAGYGFSGGYYAQVAVGEDGIAIDTIQLGNGYNEKAKTLQVYGYRMMDADGAIPDERIPTLLEKADIDDLAAVATSGNVQDLTQTAGDVLILNCGTSSTVL